MASSEKIKKYQREKFENYKKINDLKIANNEAYVEVRVDNIKSIISEYSIKNAITLKRSFLEEIDNRASFIPLEYPLVLEIYNKNFTSEEKIMVRRKVKNYFAVKAIHCETDLKYLKRKSNFFLILGLVGYVLLGVLYNINFVPYIKEIVSFLASFCIWEFAEIRLFEGDEIKENIIRYKLLSKVRVVYNKEDS